MKVPSEIAGPEVIKLFSCSTQLSMEFQMLIKSKLLKNKDFSCFQMLRCCIYHAHKYQNDCWHFNIYEHDKFHAQLSFITSGPHVRTGQRFHISPIQR